MHISLEDLLSDTDLIGDIQELMLGKPSVACLWACTCKAPLHWRPSRTTSIIPCSTSDLTVVIFPTCTADLKRQFAMRFLDQACCSMLTVHRRIKSLSMSASLLGR